MGIPRRSLWLSLALLLLSVAMTISAPAQTLTTLANFDGSNGNHPNGLIQASDGNFYGTTNTALGSAGTIFKVTPSGTLTTLYEFCSLPNCADGAFPSGALLQAADGNFYGTTSQGGTSSNCSVQYGCGTIFKMTPAGTLTTLYSFCSLTNCADGKLAFGTLIQASDGNFYGTTEAGGITSNDCAYGCGTVFKITSTGTLTTIYSFCAHNGCPDGDSPAPVLVQGTDGNFYGTTSRGGTYDRGTVFRITAGGVPTTLYSFCSQSNCTDGFSPFAGLVPAIDGNFYGTTFLGGGRHDCEGYGCGTVFKITPDGTFTVLHVFNPGRDGFLVDASLVQATDGNLYGASVGGGASNDGTIFRITPGGKFKTLYHFCSQTGCADGGQSPGGLVQATDGNFYGTTDSFGQYGSGTVFRLAAGLSPFVETQPAIGQVGAPVTILGTNLTGATNLTFNGTPATILSNTGSAIATTVPAGASTGTVQVTVGGNNLISNAGFQVVGPMQFVPVAPCRLIDTRESNPIQGGTSQNFAIPQLGGCGIPANAAAYSLNVTVVPHGSLGYLTIWPQGGIQPYVSTMNSSDGRIKANAAIVPSGNNAVSVYVSDTTDLILDIDGYFTSAGSQTYEFYPVPPCRVVDTRSGSKQPQGLGPPSLQAKQQRDLPILSSPCLQGATNPQAYSFNVTVVPSPAGQPLGYLTAWPSNQTQPVVSTLNNPTATVVANAAIVPAAPDGDIDVYADNSTDLVIDVNGYFAAPGQNGLSLYPVAPCRVVDTRNNNGQPFAGQKPFNVAGSPCAPPAEAQAYVFNATVVPPGSMPYLTLFADGQPPPAVSTLNAYDGFITSNMAVVPTTNGSIDSYAAALTQLILDLSGYFAP